MEATEKPKRTYQKHKTEKKITIKHYVNSTICDFDEHDSPIYPIYIEVIYNKKTTRFRSHLNTPQITHDYNGEEYENFDLEYTNNPKYVMLIPNDYWFREAVIRDLHTIYSIIKEQLSINPNNFEVNHLPKLYHSKYYSLSFFIDWCLKLEISNSIEGDENAFLLRLPFTENLSALHNLSFFQEEYPFLSENFNSLKTKYPSQIWHLDVFLRMMTDLYYTNHWDDSVRLSNNIYALYGLFPTVYDFQDGFFKEVFQECFFRNKSRSRLILKDMKKIFSTFYKEFEKSIINKKL